MKKSEIIRKAILEREATIKRCTEELEALKKYEESFAQAELIVSSLIVQHGPTGKHTGMADRVLESVRSFGDKYVTTKEIRKKLGKEKILSAQLGNALLYLHNKGLIDRRMSLESRISLTNPVRYEWTSAK